MLELKPGKKHHVEKPSRDIIFQKLLEQYHNISPILYDGFKFVES